MDDHATRLSADDRYRWATIDRVVLALCVLLAACAFGVKPLWSALDARMQVAQALEASGPSSWCSVLLEFSVTEYDQLSENGVDPWGRRWARRVRHRINPRSLFLSPQVMSGSSDLLAALEFEPDVSIYSCGPDGVVDGGGGDDVLPYGRADWRLVTCRSAPAGVLLCLVLAATYSLARWVPRAKGAKAEAMFVLSLAFVPALICTAGVSLRCLPLLRGMSGVLFWNSDTGLVATLFGSLLLVSSLAVAAIRLRLAPRPTPPT